MSAESERRPRRRAARAAGPTGASGTVVKTAVVPAAVEPVDVTDEAAGPARPKTPAPTVRGRRAPNRRLVGVLALVVGLLATAGLGGAVALAAIDRHDITATVDRQQRFVDTARQFVVNMFSYTQENVDESVERFVGSTSGPLRDMFSQNNNAETLKALYRDTNASSEAVINGAALEDIDETAGNASVLVAVRVTVTDLDGVNKPSQAFRLRVVVHEDDDDVMTAYDLKYPEGGN